MRRTFGVCLLALGFATPSFASCNDAFHTQTTDDQAYAAAYRQLQLNARESIGERADIDGTEDLFELADQSYREPMDVLLNIRTEAGSRTVVLPLERIQITRDRPKYSELFLDRFWLKLSLIEQFTVDLPFHFLSVSGAVFARRLAQKLPLMEKFRDPHYLARTAFELDELVTPFVSGQAARNHSGKIIGAFTQLLQNKMEYSTGFREIVEEAISRKDWERLTDPTARSDGAQIQRLLHFWDTLHLRFHSKNANGIYREYLEGIQIAVLTEFIDVYHAKTDGIRAFQSSFNVPEDGLFFLTTDPGEPLARTVYVNDTPVQIQNLTAKIGAWGERFSQKDGQQTLHFKAETPHETVTPSGPVRLWPIRYIGTESI